MSIRFLYRGFFTLILFGGFFIFQNISAAVSPKLYFETFYKTVAPNSRFAVEVLLDSETSINAFDFKILFSSSTLLYEGFDNTHALTNIWETKPSLSEEGIVKLSGGVFQPFRGVHGELVRLKFRANHEGVAKIFFGEGQVFLADGKGTSADVMTSPLSIIVSATAPLVSIRDIKDVTPPSVETNIIRVPVDNSELVIFKSEDRESGIFGAEFRVMKWFTWGAWQKGENPIRIPHGTMIFELKIRNNAGSEEISKLFIWPEIIKDVGIGVAVFTVLILIFIWFYNNKKKRQNT